MKMQWLSRVALITTAFAGLSQGAIVLTFEGIGNQSPVGNFYNGGAGGNFGIGFNADALGVIDSDAGGTGNTANEPSGQTVLFFLTGSAAIMNVSAGFDTGFSFFYSSNTTLGSISVYDGLNGTGNVLATMSLAQQFNLNCTGDPNGQYCNWTPIGVTFSGLAKSVAFAGAPNFIAFDNITLGSATPGGQVPEPSTVILLGSGLALAAALRARRS